MLGGTLIGLVVLILLFVHLKITLGAYLIGLVLVVYVLSPFIKGFFGFLNAILTGAGKTIEGEEKEMDAAKPKPAQGKKFFEESLSRTGKAIGEGEKLKAQGKKIKQKEGGLFGTLGQASKDLMKGVTGLFRK